MAGAIVRAGGASIHDESERARRSALGEAVETGAGEMPSRWVIHAATMELGGPTSAEIIRRATAARSRKADELGARSLALVAFGTGVGGFPVDEAARIEVEEVRRHLAAGSGLELIVFCVRGDEAPRGVRAGARGAIDRSAHAARPVLVAPDKFKGTLSAPEAAAAIGRGLVRRGSSASSCCRSPTAARARWRRWCRRCARAFVAAEATDPLGRPVVGGVRAGRRTGDSRSSRWRRHRGCGGCAGSSATPLARVDARAPAS